MFKQLKVFHQGGSFRSLGVFTVDYRDFWSTAAPRSAAPRCPLCVQGGHHGRESLLRTSNEAERKSINKQAAR